MARLTAYITDSVIIVGLAAVAGRLVGSGWMEAAPGGAPTAPPADPGAAMDVAEGSPEGTLIVSGIVLLYFLIEGLTGASPGKALLGLRIADEDARPLPRAKLLLRYIVKNAYFYLMLLSALSRMTQPWLERPLQIVAVLLGLIVFLGCFMAFGAGRQAYHDLLLRTAVYRRRDVEGTAAPPAD